MKKTIILACLMTCSIGIFGQAKKPVFMVFPSELYCVQHDCFYLLDTAEGTQKMPDYGKCVTEDQDMMTAINIFSQWLVDRGVEVKDLSHAIKVTYGKEAEEGAKLGKPLYHRIIESSGVDIAINMFISFDNKIPVRRSVFVEVKAIETQSGDVIASASRTSSPTSSSSNEELIQECLGFGMESFAHKLMQYFESLANRAE